MTERKTQTAEKMTEVQLSFSVPEQKHSARSTASGPPFYFEYICTYS